MLFEERRNHTAHSCKVFCTAFVPLGFLIPIVLKKVRTFQRTILICFISIVGIEIFQLITMLGYKVRNGNKL
ncbi:VanZ family protein [Paenibacillus sp. FSL H7-0331]|uniref:VanZ family protein n=1 Tax=Paenibacillus sp. FSL H7-0331 TaxID=1920421 RepID=UPI00096CF789|nr:hypothetical protein BK127_39705 [Paenibacillus sp. FSL H7-0331]